MKKCWGISSVVMLSLWGSQAMAEPATKLATKLQLEDDTGHVHALGELAGQPWILVPVYLSCPTVCPVLVAKLSREITKSEIKIPFRVVVFSFDPSDSRSALARFRVSHQLPPSWLVLRALNPLDTLKFLEGAGLRTAVSVERGFEHPAEIEVFAPDLLRTDSLTLSAISAEKLNQSLNAAAKGESLFSRLLPYLVPILIFALIASAFWYSHFQSLLVAKRSRTV